MNLQCFYVAVYWKGGEETGKPVVGEEEEERGEER